MRRRCGGRRLRRGASGRIVQVVVGHGGQPRLRDRGSLTDHPVPGRSARSPGSSTFNVESGDLSVLLHHSVQHSDSFGLMSRTGHRPCPPACRSSTGRVVPGAPSSSFSSAVATSRHLTVKQLQQTSENTVRRVHNPQPLGHTWTLLVLLASASRSDPSIPRGDGGAQPCSMPAPWRSTAHLLTQG